VPSQRHNPGTEIANIHAGCAKVPGVTSFFDFSTLLKVAKKAGCKKERGIRAS
jgi:hypothetical protein